MNWLKAKWHKFYCTFISLEGSPETIARSCALGFGIAWWPLIGTHSVFSLLAGLIFRANLPAIYFASWLCNPITIPGILALDYKVGGLFISTPDLLGLRLADLTLRKLFSLGWQVLIPMMIGGLLIGMANAIIGYYPMKYIIIRFRRRHPKPPPECDS